MSMINSGATPETQNRPRVIICEPDPGCADPHIYRWYCERDAGTKLCPLEKCRTESGQNYAEDHR